MLRAARDLSRCVLAGHPEAALLTLIADVATGVEDFYFREQIQTVIKPRFNPQLCQFLMKIIPVIKLRVRMRQDVCF